MGVAIVMTMILLTCLICHSDTSIGLNNDYIVKPSLSQLHQNDYEMREHELFLFEKILTQELLYTFTINDYLSNNREQISSSNSSSRGWFVPIMVTLGVGATIYAVYSVRGR